MRSALPDPKLVARVHSSEFDAECPDYVSYATVLLRRARQAESGSNLQPEEVVAEATLACLRGGREWPAGLDFGVFFRGVIRSTLGHALREYLLEVGKRADLGEADEVPASSRRWTERWDHQRRYEAAQAALSRDVWTRQLLDAVESGAEGPSDLVEQLGWTPEQAKYARVKASRALAAAGLRGEEAAKPRPPRKRWNREGR
jgi:hypothetical protein